MQRTANFVILSVSEKSKEFKICLKALKSHFEFMDTSLRSVWQDKLVWQNLELCLNFSSKMLFFLRYCHAVSVKTAHNDGTFCHLGSTRNKQTTLQHKFKSTQRHKLGDFEKYKMPQINKERKQRDKNFKNTKTTQSIQIKVNLDTSKKEITRLKCYKFKPLPKFIAPSRRS